jgi:hypothetical protein
MKEYGDFPGTQQVKTVQYSAECWNERHFYNNKINQLQPEIKLRTKGSGVRIAPGAPIKQWVSIIASPFLILGTRWGHNWWK